MPIFNAEEILNELEIEFEKEALTAIGFQKYTLSLLPELDGSPNDLTKFCNALTLLNLNKTTFEETAVAIIKTKLKGVARSFIGTETTITAVIEKLKTSIKPQSTKEIRAKLAAVRVHKNETAYMKEVEEICGLLKQSYIHEGVPAEKAEEYCASAATDVLVANTRVEDQNILKANNFTTVNEALAKYATTITDKVNTASVNYYRRGQNNKRGEFENRAGYNQRGYNRGYNRGYHRGYNRGGRYNYNNGDRGNGNYRGNGRGNERGNRRNFFFIQDQSQEQGNWSQNNNNNNNRQELRRYQDQE